MYQQLVPAFIIATTALAAPPPTVLKAPDPMPLDFFASAIAVSDNFMVTGFAARYPALKGRVFSVSIDGANPVIESSFATEFYGDGLGSAIGVDGDLIVVGAPWRRNTNSSTDLLAGRIHLLKRGLDGAIGEIAAVQGPKPGEKFGAAVALDDGWVIAGAPGCRPVGAPVGEFRGEVRFYGTDGTSLTPGSVIALSPGPAARNFGQSVAISGQWAAASANLFRGALPAAGTVGLMQRQESGAWSLAGTIMAPAPFAGDRFGLALALDGDLLAAGAPAPGQLGDLARGALFLYRLKEGTWGLEAVLESPSEEFCEGFGRSVAIGDDVVAVGAVATGANALDAAAVFTFRRVGSGDAVQWVPDRVRTGSASADFGAALAFAGNRLVIGVPGASGESGAAEGELIVVGLPLADLNGDGMVDGTDLAMVLGAWGVAAPGEPADLNGDGVVDGSDLAFILGNWTQP